jgi:very-short-patch-repair endonuclease
MGPSNFFASEQDPDWEMNGDPWSTVRVFDSELVSRLQRGRLDDARDVDAAYGLAQLAHRELEACGTSGDQELTDDELSLLLRSLKAVLRRLGISFDPPFHDFRGFRGYWNAHDMSGSWAARRGYLNGLFAPVLSQLDAIDAAEAIPMVRGVDGQLRNIVFASTGPKPEIVFEDAINNVIRVTRNAEYCLFYDRALTAAGLTWGELVDWWRSAGAPRDLTDELEVSRHLWRRLYASLQGNQAEEVVLRTYSERYRADGGGKCPALIPQVYLHYDPLSRWQRHGRPSALARQRMDFLLLLPDGVRIVIEVDGKQHYATGDRAEPRLYGEMMAEDRKLRLKGYDVYRFGGYEMGQDDAQAMLRKFFDELETRYAKG